MDLEVGGGQAYEMDTTVGRGKLQYRTGKEASFLN